MATDSNDRQLKNHESEEEFDPFAVSRKKNRGGGIAWLALLIGLAAVGWSGWQWWLEFSGGEERATQALAVQSLNERQASLQQQLEVTRRTLQELESATAEAGTAALEVRVQALSAQQEELAAQIRSLAAGRDAAQAELSDLRTRALGQESALAELLARNESPIRRIELREVAFLLRVANERLQLFGDFSSADRALAMADRLLASLDDPLYLSVRQSIASARGALGAVQRPDLVGLNEGINQLESTLAELPLKGMSPAGTESAHSGSGEDSDGGIWARLKATLAGLVTVRRQVEAEPLFSLEDRDYLRQGLWLQLEAARMALLREDQRAWDAALLRAEKTLDAHFATENAQVVAAIAKVELLRGETLRANLPDIGGPLQALARLMPEPSDLTAPAAAPAESEDE